MSYTVKVRLKKSIDRSYAIHIRSGSFDALAARVIERWQGKRIFIISDSTVGDLYGGRLQRQFINLDLEAILAIIPAGEQSKRHAVLRGLHTALLENEIRRESLIVALGGGVVGDVAGFAAATVLRGVEYVQIPTTLLAQVDSSVGGKVGIDHALGKNLIGAFHQPSGVFIDPKVLQTLPLVEFRNGLAEVVKIAAALDTRFFKFLERNVMRLKRSNTKLLGEIIRRSVVLKSGIVEKDERESGLRKVLNVGHTIGHALESATDYSMKHGEAVSIGMVAETILASRLGLISGKDLNRIITLLNLLKLPTKIPPMRRSRFFDALAADKKSNSHGNSFALLCGIGRTAIDVKVPQEYVDQLFWPRRA